MTFDEAHERPHEVGPDLAWAESYAFDLYDPREGLGGFLRLAVRPNEGAMEVGLHFLLSDGGLIVARHVRPVRENVADLEIGDVRFAMVAPLARWKVSYDGPAHSLASARDAAKPEAWRKSRVERLGVDLSLEATSPALGEPGRFAQAVRWTGTVWVSGDEYRVDCRGLRARAWGARDWESVRLARVLSIGFGDDFALAVAQVQAGRDEGERQHGWIFRGGRALGIRRVDLSTATEAESHLPKALSLALTDDAGSQYEIRGEVLQVMPLPRSRSGRQTLVCESVARFDCGPETGFGFVTTVDELDATGQPVASSG